MSNNSSKITSIILAVIALLFVLFGEVLSVSSIFGSGSLATGIEALQSKDIKSVALRLLFFMPIIVCVVNMATNEKTPRILAAVVMLIMPFLLGAEVNRGGNSYIGLVPGWGCMIYIVLSLILIIVAAFTKNAPNISPVHSENSDLQESSSASQPQHSDEVRRNYSPERLEEVVSQPQLYNPQLVERCREELIIRKDAQKLMEQVQTFDDAKVNDILHNPSDYSPAIIYCCQLELSRRLQVQAEQQRKAQEELIKKQEAEVEAKRQKRMSLWKKYQWLAYGVIGIILIIFLLMYFFSDGRYYSKGKDAYEEGDMASAIGYLSKVGNSHHDYTSAQWMLYNAYLSKNDSAQAARSLDQAVSNIKWDDQPDAARQYCKYLLNGEFMPYIKTDLVKAADLMSTSTSQKLRLGAAELYHNFGKYDKAYSYFSELSSKHPGSSRIAQVANGYLGLYYLYGLGNLSKDAKMAQTLLAISTDESLFYSHLLLVELALMRTPNYELIEKWSQAEDLTYTDIDPKLVKRVLQNLTGAYKRHTVGEGWTYMDNGWSNYSYDNGHGEYNGEATGGILNHSAQGWGIFTNTNTQSNGGCRINNFGRFTTQGTSCPNNGECILINYYPDNGKVIVEAGNYVQDKMVSGSTWSNSTPFTITQYMSIPF